MICVVEIRNPNWEHEQVNAGFIKCLRKAAPKSRICFWSGEEQRDCVNEIYNLETHEIESHLFDVPLRRGEPGEVERTYIPILNEIITVENPSDVFVLATSAEVIHAVSTLTEKRKVHFYMVFHQRLERELLEVDSDRKDSEPPIISAINKADSEYMHYICYSPYIKDHLEKRVPPEKVARFSFLHHPAVLSENVPKKECKDYHQIAIYGAAINEHASNIIREAAKRDNLKNCIFKVICDEKNGVLKEKMVISALEPGNRITSEVIKKLVQESEFVLIPYGREQYRLTASGIFWDAIRNNVPVITLDSLYFKYYESFDFGMIKSNEFEIIELLEKGECWGKDYSSNLKKLVEDTTRDNEKWLTKMIH